MPTTRPLAAAALMLALTGLNGWACAQSSHPVTATETSRLATYALFLDGVQQKRTMLKANSSDPAPLVFAWLDGDMPSYWDETGWDFNGVSRTAGKGDIACGYFVTTLLKDLGFDIARVNLAQAPSSVMLRALTIDIKTFGTRDAMNAHVKAQPPGAIYIVGLDFHTGFISVSEDGVFFIHSNYIGRAGVMREPAETSDALAASNFFMIGNLTANKALMNKWRSGG